MKKVMMIIFSAVLALGIFAAGTERSVASTDVTMGFYVDNTLKYSGEEFAKATKKQKKAIIKDMLRQGNKGLFVDGTNVYNFLQAVMVNSNEEFNKLAIPVPEYVKTNGELKGKEAVQEFRILSIE